MGKPQNEQWLKDAAQKVADSGKLNEMLFPGNFRGAGTPVPPL